MDELAQEIPLDRKNRLNTLFGALLTVAAEGYLFLNDMRYDYSRWSFAMVNDFDIKSEYMYHADQIWLNYIHPDDIEMYKEAVELVLQGDALLKPICYRARKADGNYILLSTRGFVLMDGEGNPEYFGGLIYPVQ